MAKDEGSVVSWLILLKVGFCQGSLLVRLDFQPLFGKRARAPPRSLFSGRNVDRTREAAAEIEPTSWVGVSQPVL